MPLISVELPGLTLTNARNQSVAYLQDLRGWHNASETQRESEQRESGFGVYRDDDPLEDARYPVVRGRLGSLRPGDEWPLRDTVMRLKNLGAFEMKVTDPTGLWRAEVVVSGRIEFDLHSDGWCHFEIPLEMDDPRKYGPLQVLSTGLPQAGVGVASPLKDPFQEGAPGDLGRVQVRNSGSAPSEPVIRLSGGLLAGVETLHLETGRLVRVTRSIPPESTVTVDHSTGEVWIDGQSPLPSTFVPVAEWFQVPAGETATFQFTSLGAISGAPRMTVEFAEGSW